MGMASNEMDALARSAIGELANMVTGTATGILSNEGMNTDITPPSIIFGEDILFLISSVQTIAIQIQSSAGMIEVNIGLEV
jgi:chemotaxis protein CheX